MMVGLTLMWGDWQLRDEIRQARLISGSAGVLGKRNVSWLYLVGEVTQESTLPSWPRRGYLTKHSHSSYGRLSDWLQEEAQLKCCQPTQIVWIKGDPWEQPSPYPASTHHLQSADKRSWPQRIREGAFGSWSIWSTAVLHECSYELWESRRNSWKTRVICTMCAPFMPRIWDLTRQLSLIMRLARKIQKATGCLLWLWQGDN